MDNKEFRALMEQSGAIFLHFGFLVKDVRASVKFLNNLPGFSKEWVFIDVWHYADTIKVGAANDVTFLCAVSNLYNAPIELVETTSGKAYHSDYVQNYGEGLHHIAYSIPNYEDYKLIVDKCKLDGYEVLFYVKGPITCKTFGEDPETYESEYCYLKAPISGTHVEINWADKNKK
jgi:catechol 2,3-dioxygenase-like lactoylglutathione lyase family enzyme